MDIDCGDNSCRFATNRGGMRTNGGCRCFENAGFGPSAVGAALKMLPEITRLRAEVEKLKEELTENEGVIRVWRGRTQRAEDEVEKLRRVRDAAQAYLNWSQGEPGDIAAIHEALRAALDAVKDEQ